MGNEKRATGVNEEAGCRPPVEEGASRDAGVAHEEPATARGDAPDDDVEGYRRRRRVGQCGG